MSHYFSWIGYIICTFLILYGCNENNCDQSSNIYENAEILREEIDTLLVYKDWNDSLRQAFNSSLIDIMGIYQPH